MVKVTIQISSITSFGEMLGTVGSIIGGGDLCFSLIISARMVGPFVRVCYGALL